MTQAPHLLFQRDPSLPPKSALPTMYDLPSEDPEEPGLPDEFHGLQAQLLSQTCRSEICPAEEMFMGRDINLYYDASHLNWYKRPDWFCVVGVPRLYEGEDLRASYVLWQEEVNPLVIVELLSPGTEDEDLGENEAPANGQSEREKPPSKWYVYEQILQVPHYIVFSRYTNQIRYFRWEAGGYRERLIGPGNSRIWIPELELGLGLWHGEYEGITRQWLRWFDRNGWIPTDAERAEQERLEKEQALERAERAIEEKEQERLAKERSQEDARQAREQLHQIVLNLLRSGLTPEQIADLTALSPEQIQQIGES
jgi:Uma2 family endonuclease